MEIYKNVRVIEGPNSGKYPYSNSLIVGKSCLMDAGAGNVLKSLRVDWVLNSHWHEDHIALNNVGKKVAAHHLDADAIENYEEFKRRYALGDFVKLFINFNFGKVDRTFEDGDVFEFEDVQIEVVHTPGHSAGHSCFVIGNIIFLADIDLTPFGPWYACIDCELRDFILSMEKIKKEISKRGITVAIPSHGEVVSGTENILNKLDAYLAKIFERDRKIKELIKLGEDPVGKGVIYRKIPEPKEIYLHFEKIMIEKHLTTPTQEFYTA